MDRAGVPQGWTVCQDRLEPAVLPPSHLFSVAEKVLLHFSLKVATLRTFERSRS